jgi:hypothetical protein
VIGKTKIMMEFDMVKAWFFGLFNLPT